MLTLFAYTLPALAVARLVAASLRRRPQLAHKIFDWLRRMGRRRLYPVMVLGMFASMFSTFNASNVHPFDVLYRQLPIALPGMLILCFCHTLMLLSWLDEAGFRIETTGRGTGSLHIHRDLDKAGTRAFVRWLPVALAECHRMGMHSVNLVSPLLRDTHRTARLMAAIEALQISFEGTPLIMTTRTIRGVPMVGPAAWSYWRHYGRFQLPVRTGQWGSGKKLLACIWRPQSGLQVSIKRGI
ncbi:hypothetical protein [Paraburkholderia youngii]|uniref:hypothetical protein n=1 Tax=Paraburkholderia youngii TaxID=2782701 RepID=UPI003D2108EC